LLLHKDSLSLSDLVFKPWSIIVNIIYMVIT
jgi:hypothetical protein